jgi:hypothetical protein
MKRLRYNESTNVPGGMVTKQFELPSGNTVSAVIVTTSQPVNYYVYLNEHTHRSEHADTVAKAKIAVKNIFRELGIVFEQEQRTHVNGKVELDVAPIKLAANGN